jgi:hypothetical protein
MAAAAFDICCKQKTYCLAADIRGIGYVLLHLGAVVKKRDEAAEAKRF